MVNKWIGVGNVGKQPESHYFPDGTCVCSFGFATNEEWKDKNSGDRKKKTTWHNLKAYRGLGDVCAKYVKQGDRLYVEGKLDYEEYERDGVKIKKPVIIISDMKMLGGRDGGQPQGGGGTGPIDGETFPETPEDDIPF